MVIFHDVIDGLNTAILPAPQEYGIWNSIGLFVRDFGGNMVPLVNGTRIPFVAAAGKYLLDVFHKPAAGYSADIALFSDSMQGHNSGSAGHWSNYS